MQTVGDPAQSSAALQRHLGARPVAAPAKPTVILLAGLRHAAEAVADLGAQAADLDNTEA